MKTTTERLNEDNRLNMQLSISAAVHALLIGGALVFGGVNDFIAGGATMFTFILIKSLISIRALLTELAERQ